MTHAQEMLDTYPKSINLDGTLMAEVIESLISCSQACTACADACLSEDTVAELTKCIRTNLDCADLCHITARILSRHTGYDANLTRSALGSAPRRAPAAQRSVGVTPLITTTAGSALRCASSANAPAARFLPQSAEGSRPRHSPPGSPTPP